MTGNEPRQRFINFTLEPLTDDQKAFAEEYVSYANTGLADRYHGGLTVERHGCGEVVLFLVDLDTDEQLTEAQFTPEELRNWVREVGHHFHCRGRLGEPEQNALHYIQLAASYADGEVTKKEMEEAQDSFEDGHDFVSTGLSSLRFRKHD